MTEKERREVQGARQELLTVISQYTTEYQQRRQKLIKLRTRQRQTERKRNLEQAEAYAEAIETELPLVRVLLGEILAMRSMLNELAA